VHAPSGLLFHAYADLSTLYRKFFGQQQNGPKPKPQQSTLAFNPPRAPKSVADKKDKNNGVQASGKAQVMPPKGNDVNGDVVVNSDLEPNQCMTNAHERQSKEANIYPQEPEGKGDNGDMMIAEPLPSSPSAETSERAVPETQQKSSPKRGNSEIKDEEDEDEEPVKKRPRRQGTQDKPKEPAKKSGRGNSTKSVKTEFVSPKVMKVDSESKAAINKLNGGKPQSTKAPSKPHHSEEANGPQSKSTKVAEGAHTADESSRENDASEVEEEEAESDVENEEKPEVAAKTREKVQATLKSIGKDPYPDWPSGEPVPYAALCTTFSLIEMTTKRLVISAHCSLFLRQVLRLTPQDLLPTVQLMINKLAADYAGIELGIGESLIMKAIGETTGRSLQIIKADQNEIGDLGLVAAKSRSNQPTMFKPKPLTVRGVLEGLMNVAIIQGDGSQGRKIAGIKKLLSAADSAMAGKGSKGVDITKDKGGASEAKFIIRFLEGKLRLGLAEKTVLVALAHAMVSHEIEKKGNKIPNSEQLAKGESILKTVYR